MADLFTPKTWTDGEQVNAVNGPNRWESGIEGLDQALDDLYDQVQALIAGGGSSRQILSGPSASRPSPAIGLEYLDTDLGKPIMGTGTSWIYFDGTAVGGGGGGTAPTGMTAVVQAGGTIGQIVLSWNAVPSATSYKLYETESPTGVSGATALTATTTTRTPSAARNYEYWVTALVSGVESATSNRVQATLPFSGGGGGGSSSDPTTFLNINGKGTATGGWWNLGIGFDTGHVDITPSQLQGGYINNPYYVMNSAGTAVQMQVFMNGGKTSTNTKYPRCEFREMATGSTSTKASWDGGAGGGHHILRGKTKVMHMAPDKPEVVVAQMHDSSDDTLQIHVTGATAGGTETWRLKINGSTVTTLSSSIALGQEVAWDIDVNNGNLTVKLDGVTKYTGNPSWGAGQYFKVGDYAQQNSTDQSNSSTEYSRIELRDLFCSHS